MTLLIGLDLHEDWDSLNVFNFFAKHTKPELVILLGDLTDKALDNEKELIDFHTKKAKVEYFLRNEIAKRNWLYKFDLSNFQMEKALPIVARDMAKRRQTPRDVKYALQDYLDVVDKTYTNLLYKYKRIGDKLGTSNIEWLTLPGNHDLDLSTTALKDQDMHLKAKEVNGLKIAGYGGSAALDYSMTQKVSYALPMFAPHFPIELTVGFEEKIEKGLDNVIEKITSEASEHFKKEKPDIILLHNPIYGSGDAVMARDEEGNPTKDKDGNILAEHSGSKALLNYAMEGHSKIIISGHIHESPIVQAVESENGNIFTVINPGPLGETKRRKNIPVEGTNLNQSQLLAPSVNDNIWGGRFMEINLDEEGNFKTGRLYQIMNPENLRDIHIIASYYKDEKIIKEMKVSERYY